MLGVDRGVVLDINGDLWVVMILSTALVTICFAIVGLCVLFQPRAYPLALLLQPRELGVISLGVALAMAASLLAVVSADFLVLTALTRVMLSAVMIGAACACVRRFHGML